MNVECQTIRVPTGVQDYRPALYGGIAADRARRRRHPPRRRSTSTRASSSGASCSPTPARRATPARTTGRSPSGTSTATGTSSTASSASATPRWRCATALERGDWDEVGRQIADRMGQPQAAGAGRHDAGDRRPDRARDGGRRDGGQGVRRRRRRLPVLLRPAAGARGDRRGARRRRRAAARLPHRDRRPAALDNHAIARILREIADLLEIKGENPFKIRAYRNGADIAANHPHELAALDETGLREIPGIGKDLAARIREIAETGDAAVPPRAARRVPADDPRSAAPAGRRAEDRRDALPRARHPHARRSRAGRARRPDPRAARAWARRRKR